MDMNIMYRACPPDAMVQSLTMRLADGRELDLVWMDHEAERYGDGTTHLRCIGGQPWEKNRHASIGELAGAVVIDASWYSETAWEPGNGNMEQWADIEIKRIYDRDTRVIYKGPSVRIRMDGTEPDRKEETI